MSTNMATMAFIRGRINILIDRLATLLLSTSNQTLAGYKLTLELIGRALATVYDDTLTPAFARGIRDQLAQMRLGLPAVHAAVVADRRTHPAFQADWVAYSQQMDKYLGFIVNRVLELSSGPLDAPRAFPVTDDHAPSDENDHRQRRARSNAPSASTLDQSTMVISSRGWTLDRLVGTASNFVRAETLDRARPDLVERVNKLIENGQPVIITGFHEHSDWSDDTFALKQLLKSSALGDTIIPVLNVLNNETRDVRFTRFIGYCKEYAPYADDDDEERLYAQDIEPPDAWKRWLTLGGAIPQGFLPLGSGDMFAHSPPGSRPENLLCYFGVGDTYAAWYKDPCGGVGQNLMVHGGHDASSFWFMVGTRDADVAASYFHTKKHELELEQATPFTTPADLADAPFTIYVAQQRRGDLVIIPPRCSHQVMNQGGLVGTLAWSRITVPSIGYAHYLELPIYNRITRAETYQLKLTLYHAVRKTAQSPPTPEMAALLDELLELLDETLIAEYSPDIHKLEPAQSGASYDAKDPEFLSCDICYADIFVSYFECAKHCQMDVCSMCYVSGRTCPCVKRMKPAVVVRFQEVLQVRNDCAKKLECAKGERVPQMSDAGIMRSSAMQTFRAACALYAARRSSSSTVQCSHSKHDVPTSDSLHCSVCDTNVCFTHLLEGPARLHAARALVDHQRLSPHEWHALHTTPLPDADDNADIVGMYLSAVTRKYVPRASKYKERVSSGWYDKIHERAGSNEVQLQVAMRLQAEVDNMVKRVRVGACADVATATVSVRLEDVVPTPPPPPPKPTQNLKRARDIESASGPTAKKRKVSQGTAGPLVNDASLASASTNSSRAP